MSGVIGCWPSFVTQDSAHAIGHSRGILQRMFPGSEHFPPTGAEESVYLPVPPFVSLNLILPVDHVGLRHATVRRASVPVTSIHEYGHPLPSKPEVRAAWQDLAASPSGDAVLPKDSDERKFGALVAPGSDSSHPSAALRNG